MAGDIDGACWCRHDKVSLRLHDRDLIDDIRKGE